MRVPVWSSWERALLPEEPIAIVKEKLENHLRLFRVLGDLDKGSSTVETYLQIFAISPVLSDQAPSESVTCCVHLGLEPGTETTVRRPSEDSLTTRLGNVAPRPNLHPNPPSPSRSNHPKKFS
jgi:hypothetical protein